VESPDRRATKPDAEYIEELAVVARLREAGTEIRRSTSIDPDARPRLRERVLSAVLDNSEKVAGARTLAGARTGARTRRTTARTGHLHGRLVIALSAVCCLVLALAGMTYLISQHALPGEPLYQVKRTVETATLGLTVGSESKGVKHLGFAANRVDDIEYMLTDGSQATDSYLAALSDFDTDAAAGSTTLTEYAAGNAPQVLGMLRDWAATQNGRLAADLPKLPAGARGAAARSIALANRIQRRAVDLLARTSCYTVTSGATDDLGALAAPGPCDGPPNKLAVGPGVAPGAVTTAPPSTGPAGPVGGPGNGPPAGATPGPGADSAATAAPGSGLGSDLNSILGTSPPINPPAPPINPPAPPINPSAPAAPITTPQPTITPLPPITLPTRLPTLSGRRTAE
jgi:hypothetical protein